jgi:hypothetical protein
VSQPSAAVGDVIGPLGLWVGQVAERRKTVTDEDLRLYARIASRSSADIR